MTLAGSPERAGLDTPPMYASACLLNEVGVADSLFRHRAQVLGALPLLPVLAPMFGAGVEVMRQAGINIPPIHNIWCCGGDVDLGWLVQLLDDFDKLFP